jgi:hypothetical protein
MMDSTVDRYGALYTTEYVAAYLNRIDWRSMHDIKWLNRERRDIYNLCIVRDRLSDLGSSMRHAGDLQRDSRTS